MGNKIFAILGGLVGGGTVIALLQMASHMIYSMPEGLDTSDATAMETYIKSLPATALLLVLLAYAVGSFAGGYLTALISKGHERILLLIVGGLFTLGGLYNTLSLPHPGWFWINLLIFIPMVLWGSTFYKAPTK